MKNQIPIDAKLLKPHRKGCSAVKLVEEGSWSHPWYAQELVHRTAKGRLGRRAYHQFVFLTCNGTNECPAEAIVSVEAIVKFVLEGFLGIWDRN